MLWKAHPQTTTQTSPVDMYTLWATEVEGIKQ